MDELTTDDMMEEARRVPSYYNLPTDRGIDAMLTSISSLWVLMAELTERVEALETDLASPLRFSE